MKLDDVLTKILDAIVEENKDRKGIKGCNFLAPNGFLYTATSVCFLKRFLEEDERATYSVNQAVPYGSLELMQITDASRVDPAVMLSEVRIPLTGDITGNSRMLFLSSMSYADKPGMLLLEHIENGIYEERQSLAYKNDAESLSCSAVPLFPYAMADAVINTVKSCGVTFEDLQASIRLTLTGMPVIYMATSSMFLVSTLKPLKGKEQLTEIRLQDGTVLVPSSWDQSRAVYKRLTRKKTTVVKEEKMQSRLGKLALGAKIVKQNDEEKHEEPTVAPETSQVTEPDKPEAAQAPVEAKPEAEPVQAVDNSKEETAKQAPVPEPEVQTSDTVEVAKKKRTTRPVKSVGLDLAHVIEELSSPVEALTADKVEAAQQDVKSLRDLVIAASRRMANIDSELAKLYKPALEALNVLRTLVK